MYSVEGSSSSNISATGGVRSKYEFDKTSAVGMAAQYSCDKNKARYITKGI